MILFIIFINPLLNPLILIKLAIYLRGNMDALLMAGGKGTRLKADVEKPLLPILKKPMIDYVIQSLLNSKIENIYIAVSPNTRKTKKYLFKKYCNKKRIKIIDTPGKGYIHDINYSMRYFSEPFMVICCDIPTITPKVIDEIIDEYYTLRSKNMNLETLCVVVEKNKYLSSSTIAIDNYIPIGINILCPVNRGQVEKLYVLKEPVLNVNTLEEKKIVESFISSYRL